MAEEIPIDLVMRARDEMSAVLDKVASEAESVSGAFEKMGDSASGAVTDMSQNVSVFDRVKLSIFGVTDAAKQASGIRFDETTNRWRDANSKFISSQEAMKKGFTEADKEIYQYKKSADDAESSTTKLAKSMESGGSASSGFSTKVIALGNMLGNLASQAISSVVSGIGEIATAMIQGNAEFERYETQFGVLLGSTQAAKDRLKELADFGAKTPFELPEVVRADKVLQGFGLHSQEAAKRFGFSGTQIRTIAGDLAAGTGQNFEDMARYLGQFASGSTGEAISRFQELGITTREELAKMGLEFSKSGELTTPTQEAFGVLLRVAQTKFGGMMDAQSKTFEGMMSNLEDWKGNTIRAIGAPIFEVLKDKLGAVLEFLNRPETMKAITDFADTIASALATVITWVETNWPTIQAVIGDVFDGIALVWDNVLKPTIDFIISLFGDLFTNTEKNFGGMQNKISDVMRFIGDIIKQVLDTVWALWEDNGSEIMSFVRTTWTTISDIVSGVVNVVLTLIQKNMPLIQDRINQAMAAIRIAFEVVWGAVKIIVGTSLELVKGIVNTALALLNGDTEGALNTIRDTFTRVWDNIKSSVSGIVDGMLSAINDYLNTRGSSIEWWANTIKNRTTAMFQEMRDNITLAFNQMVDNLRRAMDDVLRFYNTIAPFMGFVRMPMGTQAATGSGGQFIAPAPSQRGGGSNANVTVNVYGGDAGSAERGTVNALRRAGFAISR